MKRLADAVQFRIRALFRGSALADDVDREIAFHIDMEAERLRGTGVAADEAQRQARIAFGGRQRFREEAREAIGGRGLSEILDQIRQAGRTLRKHIGFTTVAVLSLALAIALNTTMYSVLDALVNPHLDMRHPEQLYSLAYYGDFRNRIHASERNAMLRSGGRTYSALTFSGRVKYFQSLIEHGEVNHRADVGTVFPDYFAFLGVRAAEGRVFTADDMNASERPIVLSQRLRRHLFPGDQTPLGARITIDGDPFVVIGVVSKGAQFAGDGTGGWVLPPAGTALENQQYNLIRLRDGVTQAQAEAELETLSGRIAATVGERQADNAFRIGSALQRQLHLNNFHLALIAAVIAVLLVACANLANLQLARGIARRRELATRAALGASRGDLVRHLVLESSLLGFAGLALGLVLTYWGMHVLIASIPDSIGEYVVEPQTSWRMFAFALGASLVCLVLMGLLPAIRASRVDLNELIKSGNGTGALRHGRRQYGLLLVAEIGFALLLACGASLLVRSARQIAGDHVGYDTAPLTTGMILAKVPVNSAWPFASIEAELTSRLRALRDVADAAVSMGRVDPDNEVTATDPAGTLRVAPATLWSYTVVSPSYFRAYGVGILHGRDFREGEQGPVAIVDPQTARALWPDSPPVGQMIKFGSPGTAGVWYTVIGVHAPMGMPGTPTIEEALAPRSTKPGTQSGAHYMINGRERSVFLAASSPGRVYVLPTAADSVRQSHWTQLSCIVRARHNPTRLPLTVRQAFAGDARLRVIDAQTYDDFTGATVARANHNFVAAMFTLFALLAIALAAFGVYAIVAHSVSERRREVGVRLALGASDLGVLEAILREGNGFALAGIALGLFLTRYGTGWLRAFLWVPEVDPFSIELFIPAAIGLFAIAVVAALIPAWRATRIDPVESLRCE